MKKFNCDSELPVMVQVKAITSDRLDEHFNSTLFKIMSVCVCVCVWVVGWVEKGFGGRLF